MTFKSNDIETFLKIFDKSKNKIASFNGCEYLELVRDKDNKNIFFTISKWKGDKYLEQYRNSELFKRTWSKTKILFDDKPVAWSTHSIFNT